jgi:hypothetical protein
LGREEIELEVNDKLGVWLIVRLNLLAVGPTKTWTFEAFQKEFTQAGLGDFSHFWQGELVEELREMGLLVV